jgi:hypothetical protein
LYLDSDIFYVSSLTIDKNICLALSLKKAVLFMYLFYSGLETMDEDFLIVHLIDAYFSNMPEIIAMMFLLVGSWLILALDKNYRN